MIPFRFVPGFIGIQYHISDEYLWSKYHTHSLWSWLYSSEQFKYCQTVKNLPLHTCLLIFIIMQYHDISDRYSWAKLPHSHSLCMSPWLYWCSPEILKHCLLVLAYSCIIHCAHVYWMTLYQPDHCWTALTYTLALYAHDHSSLILLTISVMDNDESNTTPSPRIFSPK